MPGLLFRSQHIYETLLDGRVRVLHADYTSTRTSCHPLQPVSGESILRQDRIGQGKANLHSTIQHKHLLPLVFHHVFTHPLNQEPHARFFSCLINSWHVYLVGFLISKKEFEPATIDALVI